MHAIVVGTIARRESFREGFDVPKVLPDLDFRTAAITNGAYVVYRDPRRDEWETKSRPALKKIPLATLEQGTGLCKRALIDLREGRSWPHAKNRARLGEIVRELVT